MLMQTRYIPGDDYSGFAKIGQAIADIINPHRQEKEAIRAFLLENPEIFQSLSEARRQTETEQAQAFVGQAANAKKKMEGRPTDVNVLKAYHFSPKEEAELFQLAPETSAERIRKILRKADVEGKTAEQILAQIRAATGEAKATTAEATERQRGAEARTVLGVPEMEARARALETKLRQTNTQLQQKVTEHTLQQFARWVPMTNLLTGREKLGYLAGQFAPEYLRDIQLREQMSLDALIASIKQGPDPLDLFAFTMKADDHLAELVKQARDAEDKHDTTRLRGIIEQINNLAALRRQYLPGEVFTTLAYEDQNWLGRARIRYRTFGPQTLSEQERQQYMDSVDAVAAAMASGMSRQDALGTILQGKEFRENVWSNLGPDEIDQFWRDVEQNRAVLGAPTGEQSSARSTGRAVGSAVGAVGEVAARANPAVGEPELINSLTNYLNEFAAGLREQTGLPELITAQDLENFKNKILSLIPGVGGGE